MFPSFLRSHLATASVIQRVVHNLTPAGIAMGTFQKVLVGAAAGAAATVPMTAAMLLSHRFLPAHLQYPLPPRLITDRLAATNSPQGPTAGLNHVPTMAAHFAFGAGTGALYAMLPAEQEPVLSGMAFGVAVWAASYLGWVPVSGLLEPATRHPKERVAMMIGAHLVWGAALGQVTHALRENA
jgi:hypothetical protein